MHSMTLPQWVDATNAALARIGERLGAGAPSPVTNQEAQFYCDVEASAAAAMIAFSRITNNWSVVVDRKMRVLDPPVGSA